MDKEELIALLKLAASLNIDGADDALETIIEVADDIEKLQVHMREIKKILKRLQRRF